MKSRNPGRCTLSSGHVDPSDPSELSSEALLEYFLSLPKQRRDQEFTETSKAATITGLSQRTIQLWIEIGVIRAIHIGGKYKILLESLKSYLRTRLE
ncbi:MAG: helix-turn-helix domain-containing protein [Acidobacteriia bacterium]|nr:helix-turn-helix domain-containing protein [Terriglobia bacterium]